MYIFQKTSIRFLKDFGPQCIIGKMYSRHLFCNRGIIHFHKRLDCNTAKTTVYDQHDIFIPFQKRTV